MQVKWLIENFAADNKIWKLIEEVKSRGQPLEVIDYYNFYLNNKVVGPDGMPSNSTFKDDDCVVAIGSIQLALWVKRHKPWVPGVWLDPEKFKCTYFYSYLGDFLFNKGYEFTTIGEFKRKKEVYYNDMGIDNCLFIRPDSGLKSFTGQIFQQENHDRDWLHFDNSTKAEDIIVLAMPTVIRAEYRFVIGQGEIIAASMYQKDGKPQQLPGAPKDAHEAVADIVKVIEKDCPIAPMYVIDVAQDYNFNFKLLELNSFTSAGLYEADKKAVVDATNRIALEEFKSYQNV